MKIKMKSKKKYICVDNNNCKTKCKHKRPHNFDWCYFTKIDGTCQCVPYKTKTKKQTCYACRGQGDKIIQCENGTDVKIVPCENCNGEGKI